MGRSCQVPAIIVVALLPFYASACAPVPIQARADEPETKPAPVPPGIKVTTDLPDLIEAHNRERSEQNLGPVKADAKLTAAARSHALDMAAHGTMTHEGSDGSTPAQRVNRQRYRYRRTGENVAMGQRTVSEVMRGWMNSPHHRDNILGAFSQIGVAKATDPAGRSYWCVVLGEPWPTLDPSRASSDLLEALNRARSDAGQPALTANPILARVAQAHAEAMASSRSFRPESERGTTLDRVEKAGYRYRRLGQVDAAGQSSGGEVARSWLDHETHKKNLLNPSFTDVGVGSANAEDGTPYWSLILGQPRT